MNKSRCGEEVESHLELNGFHSSLPVLIRNLSLGEKSLRGCHLYSSVVLLGLICLLLLCACVRILSDLNFSISFLTPLTSAKFSSPSHDSRELVCGRFTPNGVRKEAEES